MRNQVNQSVLIGELMINTKNAVFSNNLGFLEISTNPMIIDNLRRFTIADLKRLGYFVPDGVVSGVLTWGEGDNKSSIRVTMDNNRMVLSLNYVVNREKQMNYNVTVIERAANLGKGVVRFFLCPITHKPCRKLYLYDGAFISRRALSGAMYSSQTKSKWERAVHNGCLREDYVPYKRYGKPYYRGKITPYGKRIQRHQNIVDRAEAMLFDWLLRNTKICRVTRKFHT